MAIPAPGGSCEGCDAINDKKACAALCKNALERTVIWKKCGRYDNVRSKSVYDQPPPAYAG